MQVMCLKTFRSYKVEINSPFAIQGFICSYLLKFKPFSSIVRFSSSFIVTDVKMNQKSDKENAKKFC